MADRWQVELFLHEFRQCWPPDCLVENREKNSIALAELGLTPALRTEAIFNLTVSNYVEGPNPDHDRPGQELWVFGATIEGAEIYIKLKIFETKEGRRVGKCLSFHRAEQRLPYPFR